jgi:hypothetical protein
VLKEHLGAGEFVGQDLLRRPSLCSEPRQAGSLHGILDAVRVKS